MSISPSIFALPVISKSPLALMFPLEVISPTTLKLSLKLINSPSPPADSNLEAMIVPLALMFPLAVICEVVVKSPSI